MRKVIVQEFVSIDGRASGRTTAWTSFPPRRRAIRASDSGSSVSWTPSTRSCCPIVLGSGKKLFPDGKRAMELLDTRSFDGGTVLLSYAPGAR